eukprot:4467980-Pleurochrysis_carterae.AAC.1
MGARSLHNLATTVRDAPKLRDALLEAEQAGRSAANAARIHIGRKHFDPPRECKDEALWLADFLHTRGLTAFKAGARCFTFSYFALIHVAAPAILPRHTHQLRPMSWLCRYQCARSKVEARS